jgi:hypothetical protein
LIVVVAVVVCGEGSVIGSKDKESRERELLYPQLAASLEILIVDAVPKA